MKYLIADGGATKTDWCLTENGVLVNRINTIGINPFHADESRIKQIISDELMPHLNVSEGTSVYFYGAGCTPEKSIIMERLLGQFFPDSDKIVVLSDLWGAARALCGHQPGIACILGTGSNSCYFDGQNIVSNTPPLGYILGDEGSGAVLGKMLVADILKGVMSKEVRDLFFEETQLTKEDFLDRIYRTPMPSRFLASLVPFLGRHRNQPELRDLIVRNFRQFFIRNIRPYNQPDMPVGFIGGLASSYAEELKEAAALERFRVGQIMQSPMDGLLRYHCH